MDLQNHLEVIIHILIRRMLRVPTLPQELDSGSYFSPETLKQKIHKVSPSLALSAVLQLDNRYSPKCSKKYDSKKKNSNKQNEQEKNLKKDLNNLKKINALYIKEKQQYLIEKKKILNEKQQIRQTMMTVTHQNQYLRNQLTQFKSNLMYWEKECQKLKTDAYDQLDQEKRKNNKLLFIIQEKQLMIKFLRAKIEKNQSNIGKENKSPTFNLKKYQTMKIQNLFQEKNKQIRNSHTTKHQYQKHFTFDISVLSAQSINPDEIKINKIKNQFENYKLQHNQTRDKFKNLNLEIDQIGICIENKINKKALDQIEVFIDEMNSQNKVQITSFKKSDQSCKLNKMNFMKNADLFSVQIIDQQSNQYEHSNDYENQSKQLETNQPEKISQSYLNRDKQIFKLKRNKKRSKSNIKSRQFIKIRPLSIDEKRRKKKKCQKSNEKCKKRISEIIQNKYKRKKYYQ